MTKQEVRKWREGKQFRCVQIEHEPDIPAMFVRYALVRHHSEDKQSCSDMMVSVAFQFCFAAAILCPCVRFDVLTVLIMKSIICLVQVY